MTYDSLLTQIMSTTLDQDYQVAAQRRASRATKAPGARRVTATVVVVLFGAMIGVSALRAQQQRPVEAAERGELVAQIHLRQHRLDNLNSELSRLEHEVANLQSAVTTVQDRQRQVAAAVLALAGDTGAGEVRGPGLSVVTDNAPSAGESTSGTILDTDLQQLVNALWSVGAEAIAINGHRLTSVTAIRTAGQAITVDYRSLTPPYTVDAIGDPQTLPAKLLSTAGGQAWEALKANFGIRFDVRPVTNLVLPGASGTTIREARPVVGTGTGR